MFLRYTEQAPSEFLDAERLYTLMSLGSSCVFLCPPRACTPRQGLEVIVMGQGN